MKTLLSCLLVFTFTASIFSQEQSKSHWRYGITAGIGMNSGLPASLSYLTGDEYTCLVRDDISDFGTDVNYRYGLTLDYHHRDRVVFHFSPYYEVLRFRGVYRFFDCDVGHVEDPSFVTLKYAGVEGAIKAYPVHRIEGFYVQFGLAYNIHLDSEYTAGYKDDFYKQSTAILLFGLGYERQIQDKLVIGAELDARHPFESLYRDLSIFSTSGPLEPLIWSLNVTVSRQIGVH